jgi:hypothetical protein
MKRYYSLGDYIEMLNITEPLFSINDIQGYINNPEYNFVYNKLFLSQSQGIPSAPMGIYPQAYPVIFKPIYNLYGMSRSFYIINSDEEYDMHFQDGLFWQPYFPGHQTNLDIVYDNDHIAFYSTLRSVAGSKGSFKSHETLLDFKIPDCVLAWLDTHMKGYRGCLNIELIGNYMIECHLRLNGDFHLYDPEFVLKLNEFMLDKNIHTIDYKVGYTCMFPLFITRNQIDSLNKNRKKFLRFLMKNPFVKTFYFDDPDSIQQSHLIRGMMIELSDYEHGEQVIELFQKTLNESE